MTTKLTPAQREELVDKLTTDLVDGAERMSSFLYAVLRDGYKGFANYKDQELLDAHVEAFDEDFLKGDGDEA